MKQSFKNPVGDVESSLCKTWRRGIFTANRKPAFLLPVLGLVTQHSLQWRTKGVARRLYGCSRCRMTVRKQDLYEYLPPRSEDWRIHWLHSTYMRTAWNETTKWEHNHRFDRLRAVFNWLSKNKTKANTPTNHNGNKELHEPITIPSK